jgi:predicted DsbA family dithiol-disulfide isomerase
VRLRDELGDELKLTWKAFLLRPYPKQRSIEKFREYTQSWLRPASQPEGGRFRPWASEESPPSHSVPPQVAAKAAARLGGFDRYHLAVMDAYFFENRNVSDPAVLIDIAEACGLDPAAFAEALQDEGLVQLVIDEHNEAVEAGVTGVPTVVAPNGFQIPGAQDLAFYRHLVRKLRAV